MMRSCFGPVGASIAAIVLVALPLLGLEPYHRHLLTVILIWSLAYTAWSLMGRFGLVSLGHGAFMGVGAYAVTLLWNGWGLSPWLGIPIALALAALTAVVIGYPCFRFRIVGHYFALVTLALTEVVRLTITAARGATGGSLGMTPVHAPAGQELWALQFTDKRVFYWIALGAWAVGLWIWWKVDRSMARYALEAISEDEDAAAAAGVNVTAQKLRITMLSAVMTAFAGVLYGQYQMYINPDTVSGIGVSLQIVFAVVVGGIYVMLGPTVGAVITILLAEGLRVMIGTALVGLDTTIYGVMLVLFIIFLPQGILGSAMNWWKGRTAKAGEPLGQPDRAAVRP
jgi:branched-chain amino acid transport system permease protein